MARTKQDCRTPIDPTPLNSLPQGTAPIIRSGDSAVIYHIPTSPPTLQFTETSATPTSITTILLPKNSTWTSGLHWHNNHTEYLRLVQGSIFVRLGSDTQIISAVAGGRHDMGGGLATGGLVIKVDKGMRHNWGRAQHHLFQRYCGGVDRSSGYAESVVFLELERDHSGSKPECDASVEFPKNAEGGVGKVLDFVTVVYGVLGAG
jgi:hypothetical protein